jgi:hypothetical protein
MFMFFFNYTRNFHNLDHDKPTVEVEGDKRLSTSPDNLSRYNALGHSWAVADS